MSVGFIATLRTTVNSFTFSSVIKTMGEPIPHCAFRESRKKLKSLVCEDFQHDVAQVLPTRKIQIARKPTAPT